MRKFGAALVMGVLLVTAGCGGGGRPSADEVSKALQKGGDESFLGPAGKDINQKATDCMAQALVDSKISDEALQAIVDGDKDHKVSATDNKALKAVTPKVIECVTAEMKK